MNYRESSCGYYTLLRNRWRSNQKDYRIYYLHRLLQRRRRTRHILHHCTRIVYVKSHTCRLYRYVHYQMCSRLGMGLLVQ